MPCVKQKEWVTFYHMSRYVLKPHDTALKNLIFIPFRGKGFNKVTTQIIDKLTTVKVLHKPGPK
jgi:hypothetical protein